MALINNRTGGKGHKFNPLRKPRVCQKVPRYTVSFEIERNSYVMEYHDSRDRIAESLINLSKRYPDVKIQYVSERGEIIDGKLAEIEKPASFKIPEIPAGTQLNLFD